MNNFTWKFSSKMAETADDGWHRLTSTQPYTWSRTNMVETIDALGQVIKFEFDYISWGGNGADGLALYLFDPTIQTAEPARYLGETLGYVGFPGGYVGIGLDERGNFSRGPLNKPDGPTAGHVAVIRGSAARGWARAGSAAVTPPLAYLAPKYTTRQQAVAAGGIKHVVAKFTPKKYRPGYEIDLSINDQVLFKAFDYPYAAPASLKAGISASTGGSTNNHEIRNLQLEVVEAVEPGCPENGNLIRNVPAYISAGVKLFYYPQLNDGDHVHKDWDGSGKWGNLAGQIVLYGVDLTGTQCEDSESVCAAPPGKGAVEMNTAVIYSRQDDGIQQEPGDSTTFTQHGAVNFEVEGQEENNEIDWITLASITGNNLVRRTVTFPARRLWRLQVRVWNGKSTGPALYGFEAYNR